MTTPTSDDVDRPFPLPLWVLSLSLLVLELSLYAWAVNVTLIQKGHFIAGVVVMSALPLLLRLLVAFAAYRLSRWKGMTVPVELGLRTGSWTKFFLIEYTHLCVQNLLLIPFRALFRTATERGRGPASGPVVLLQHGYVNNGGVWYFTARALERLGYRVFTVDQPVFASIDTMGDLLAVRVDEVLTKTGAVQLSLVAHSMGGLVCRAYLRRHGGAKIKRLVTLGTPHHGTFHAYLANGRNGMQMRLGNEWLTSLGTTNVGVPFTSIYSVHDTIIAPQDSSIMPGAINVRLSGIGHVSMPSGAAARHHLLQALSTD